MIEIYYYDQYVIFKGTVWSFNSVYIIIIFVVPLKRVTSVSIIQLTQFFP